MLSTYIMHSPQIRSTSYLGMNRTVFITTQLLYTLPMKTSSCLAKRSSKCRFAYHRRVKTFWSWCKIKLNSVVILMELLKKQWLHPPHERDYLLVLRWIMKWGRRRSVVTSLASDPDRGAIRGASSPVRLTHSALLMLGLELEYDCQVSGSQRSKK